MDHVTKEVRSKIMAAVHSQGNTTTELPLARLLWAAGIRGYRKHWNVPGKPDFAWPGRKLAVFVDGCFWHGCRCKYLPRTNTEFWKKKIENNKRRDRHVTQALRRNGWTVLRIRECVVRKPATLARIARALGRPH
ncbi:MAG: very short patch repair endonuclease [Acidobacteriaceae bacterium]|nr:very short patch repair endonuclease [Acidobacteriaceae bacterium]MBV9294136.1 very short patch repair endonuclease [Acidobacteriaceae bacterium]